MGREIKRVIEGFDWPHNKVWEGFMMPEWLREGSCPDCKNGYSDEAQHMFDQWYGYAPFDPSDTKSPPLTVGTPKVRAFAQRNIDHSPGHYGTSDDAVTREAGRMSGMWNRQWSHHLAQEDADALVDGDRLWDLTRVFVPGEGWKERDPARRPTAAEVNDWSIGGFGHDGLNASVVIAARCEREGVPHVCASCEGRAATERFKGQRELAEKWQDIDPPAGEWWQLWGTVSEGSPVTPAFATAEELALHISRQEPDRYESTLAWITKDGWAPSGIIANGTLSTATDLIAGGGIKKTTEESN